MIMIVLFIPLLLGVLFGGLLTTTASSLPVHASIFNGILAPSGSSRHFTASQQAMPNVIFLIGDGMGPEYLKIASLVEYGTENGTIMEQAFPYHSLYDTRNILNETTDSAAGGTALATGHLTTNERIAMDARGKIPFKTILEYLMQDFNYSAGLVTTDELYGATPATFAAHVTTRDHKSQIFSRLLTSGIDVLLGGGLHSPFAGGVEGVTSLGMKYGYEVATNPAELLSASQTAERLLGLFGGSQLYSLPFEIDRNPSDNPSILDMTSSALNVLSRKDVPFFLMVEGARIDHAGHQNNLTRAVFEAIMFEKVVRQVLAFARENGNTIVVVGADHETGGLQLLNYTLSDNILPRAGLTREENNSIRLQRIQNLTVSWSTNGHTDTLVSFYAYGSQSFLDIEVKRTPDVFWAVNGALEKFSVIRSHQFAVDGDRSLLNATITIRDLDKDWNQVTLHVEYENGSIITRSLNMTPTNVEETLTLPSLRVDLQANFTAWLSIEENDGTVITSLRYHYRYVPETSISDTESSTTEIEFTTPLDSMAPLIVLSFLGVLAILQRSKRKNALQ